MRIALNAQLLSDQEGYRGAGVSNYSRQLLRALGELVEAGATPHRFTAFVNARDFRADGISLTRTQFPLHRPLARIAWEQTALPLQLQRQPFDLIHGLMNVLPIATTTPGVVTVHDLAFVRMPQTLPPLKRAYLTALCRVSTARAARRDRRQPPDRQPIWNASSARRRRRSRSFTTVLRRSSRSAAPPR